MENQTAQTKFQNPLAYLKLFFRRKWFLVTPLFWGVVLGIVLMLVMPPTFESSTVILVEEQRTINPLIQDLAVSTSVAQRLQTLREQILSWNNLNDLIKKLNLDREVKTQLDFEGLVAGLRKKIVVQMRAQNLFSISYRGEDAKETFEVVKTLTDIFIQENMRSVTKETDVAIDFLSEQLQVYKRKIKESEVNNLEEQLRTLLIDSTSEHPQVQELQQQLAKARAELDSGEFKVQGAEKPVTSQVREMLQQELDKITQQQQASASGSSFVDAMTTDSTDQSNTALYKLFLMDRLDQSMARDIQVNERIYNMLLERLETAKITQRLEASKQGTRYTIIDPPRLPLKPVKPPTMMLLIGMFMGGASGVGLVFGREFLDQSFIDIEDAKANLSAPVLGAISRITTHDEMRQERNKRIIAVFVSMIIGGALVVGAILYALLGK